MGGLAITPPRPLPGWEGGGGIPYNYACTSKTQLNGPTLTTPMAATDPTPPALCSEMTAPPGGQVRRGTLRGAAVALKGLFLLRTDAASTAAFGGALQGATDRGFRGLT